MRLSGESRPTFIKHQFVTPHDRRLQDLPRAGVKLLSMGYSQINSGYKIFSQRLCSLTVFGQPLAEKKQYNTVCFHKKSSY